MYNSMYFNGFNPYTIPNAIPKQGITKGLLGGISKVNWGNLLNNTQKTLNVINQAIPVYYQMKPIYNNAKTMFRLLGSFNDKTQNNTTNNRNYNNNDNSNNNIQNEKNISNKPIFFS